MRPHPGVILVKSPDIVENKELFNIPTSVYSQILVAFRQALIRTPFDGMLIAQAQAENIPIISAKHLSKARML